MLAIGSAFAAAAVAHGQDLEGIPGAEVFSTYKTAVIIAIIALIGFMVGGLVFRWVQRRQSARSTSFDFGDLTQLQKRGLLTPEEMRKVRNALIRQATQNAKHQAKPLKGAEALLHDKEIKRLEALAEAKRMERQLEQGSTDSAASADEIPPELRTAVESGLLSREEARAIAARARGNRNM
jgi:hypothetical protein